MFFSRLLAAILIANFLTLVFMNLFELPVYSAVFALLGFTVASFHLMSQLRVRRRRAVIDRPTLWIAAATLILLTVPRLVYLAQWLPDVEVRVVGDDYARLAELTAMTLSDHYPLRHPANADFLLSFYYTSLYPLAALRLVLPFLTLKDVVVIGNLFYHTLVLLSVVEVAHVLFRRPSQIRWLVFLCMLFSGLDWLTKATVLTASYEWWQRDFFAGNTQISSFFTAMFWVIHHYLGFYAIVLAAIFLFYAVARYRWQKPLAVSLLGVTAFYTSPFSFLAVPFFGLIHWRVLWRHVISTWMFGYVIVLALAPLFIFIKRLPSSTVVLSTFQA